MYTNPNVPFPTKILLDTSYLVLTFRGNEEDIPGSELISGIDRGMHIWQNPKRFTMLYPRKRSFRWESNVAWLFELIRYNDDEVSSTGWWSEFKDSHNRSVVIVPLSEASLSLIVAGMRGISLRPLPLDDWTPAHVRNDLESAFLFRHYHILLLQLPVICWMLEMKFLQRVFGTLGVIIFILVFSSVIFGGHPSGRNHLPYEIPHVDYALHSLPVHHNSKGRLSPLMMERREQVKSAFLHTWRGYAACAWGYDEVLWFLSWLTFTSSFFPSHVMAWITGEGWEPPLLTV